MMTLTKRVMLLFIAVVSSTVLTFAPLMSQTAHAAADNPEDQLERWLYYRGIRACFEGPDFDSISPGGNSGTKSVSKLEDKGIEEYNHKEGFGYLADDLDGLDGKDGTVQCDGDSSGKIWNNVADVFDFGSVKAVACALNEAASDLGDGGRIKPSPDVSPCIDNATEFEFEGGGNIWQEMVTKMLEDPTS